MKRIQPINQSVNLRKTANYLDNYRKGKAPKYGINSTFLPGHFKGYSIALNPLDGIYYFDLRPNMKNDNYLKQHIKEFDSFLVEDIWKFKEAYLDFSK